MITWVDVAAIIFALSLAVVGIWRGFFREILVSLAGIVLGVFAGSLWATSYGAEWAAKLGANAQVFQGVIGLLSLVLIVLFIGYGSALFLPRRPLSLWQRLAGGGIGLLNGLFLAAFAFSYIQRYFLGDPPPADSILMTALISSAMIRWLPVILGGIIGIVTLAVVIVVVVRLVRYISRLVQEPAHAAPPPTVAVAGPAVPAPAPTPAPAPVPGPTVPCPNCGNSVPVGVGFCSQCGKTLS